MPPTARRIVLHPAAAYGNETLESSAFEIVRALDGRTVRTGDSVSAAEGTFVVTATDPPHAVRGAPSSALEILAQPLPVAQHATYEAVFLLDASWSMSRPDFEPSRFEAARRAIAQALPQSGDVLHRAALAVFTRETALLAPWDVPARLDVRSLDGVEPRGRSDLAEAVSGAVAEIRAGADPRKHHAILALTDATADPEAFRDAVGRARRLRVEVHLLHLVLERDRAAEEAVRGGGGSYTLASESPALRAALGAMAAKVGLPFHWHDDPTSGEAEVVARTAHRAPPRRGYSTVGDDVRDMR